MGIGLQHGISSAGKRLAMLTRFVTRVFPGVERELKQWQEMIKSAGDEELRRQGEASIEKKKFHCLGGGFYALMEGAGGDTLSFIVALQTISDYLDNLCDRAGCLDKIGRASCRERTALQRITTVYTPTGTMGAT